MPTANSVKTTTNSAALVATSAGVPVWTSAMTDGQVVIGSTGATPTAASLTAGTNITITPGAGSISIASTGGGGMLQTATITVTSAEIKALRATPKQLVAAAGSNTVIIPIALGARYVYAGTNQFTNGQNLRLTWGTSGGNQASPSDIFSTATIEGSNSRFTVLGDLGLGNIPVGGADNQALLFSNAGASEITGNAANDNTMILHLAYWIATLA